MSIDSFFTITKTGAAQGFNPSGKQGDLNAQIAAFGFFEFWLAQAIENERAQDIEDLQEKAEEERESSLKSDNPLLAEKPKLDIVEMLAVNDDVKEQIGKFSTEETNVLSDTLALNQTALIRELKPLLEDGLLADKNVNPEDQEFGSLANPFAARFEDGEYKTFLERLEKLINDGGSPEGIVANLTPEQRVILRQKLQAFQAQSEGTEKSQAQILADVAAFEDLESLDEIDESILALIAIQLVLPAQSAESSGPDSIIAADPVAALAASQAAASRALSKPNEDANNGTRRDLGSYLNNIDPGTGKSSTLPSENFEKSLRDIAGAPRVENASADTGKTAVSALPASQNAAAANMSILQGWHFSSDGSLLSPLGLSSDSTDGSFAGNLNYHSLQNASLTSLVTQAQGAQHPHPATQMIAVSMTRAGVKGGDQTMRIQLDPPELGRVEIQMTVGKDKSVKAHLIAEKPETLGMLQRDATLLERALQDAGLEADGSSLTFDLADEGYNFDQNGGHDGSRNAAGQGDNGEEEIEIIDSTMTWHVDSETGHMRYDILA